MLVNYKVANMMIVEMGEGKQKLKLEPGINVIEESVWEAAKKTLDDKIESGVVVPIYKTTKKDGKEIKEPCKPDEIPDDKVDAVVEEIQSESQADKFYKASTKESVRAKAMNRKNRIAEDIKDRESK